MPLVVSGLPQHVATLRGVSRAESNAAADAVNAAAKAAGEEAADYTSGKFNLDRDVVAKYVSVAEASISVSNAATITLKVRAVPLEDFNPQIVMKQFNFIDSRGRHVSRVLPAVYFTRLRGGTLKLLRPAFPLRTRTTGPLLPGDVIRRRIGADRRLLTRIRFYTFPVSYLKGDLVPHLQEVIGNVAGVTFKAAFRRRNGSLRQPG